MYRGHSSVSSITLGKSGPSGSRFQGGFDVLDLLGDTPVKDKGRRQGRQSALRPRCRSDTVTGGEERRWGGKNPRVESSFKKGSARLTTVTELEARARGVQILAGVGRHQLPAELGHWQGAACGCLA